MKIVKKLFAFTLACFAVLSLASCGKGEEKNIKSYVTLEINPSVEIVLDEDNAVITINGLNDDGKMLISDEKMIGKDIEEVLDIVIEEAQACGYLVSNEVANAVQNNIKVSVSSSEESHLVDLEAQVKSTVESIIDKEKINAEFEKLATKKREYFASIAKQYDPSLTDEKIAEMSDEELYVYVELATIEKAELATIEMEKYYLSMKNYEFQIQYKEQIAKKLETLSSLTSTMYKAAINALKTAIDSVNKLQYDIFVSEDSEYLKLLSKLNEYKDNNIVLNHKLSKGQTQEGGTEITVVINTNKEKITEVESQIILVMNEFNKSLETFKKLIQDAINTLETLEKNISNVNYTEIMTNVEVSINDAKDGLLAKFEEEHADDIKASKDALKQRKQSLEISIVR